MRSDRDLCRCSSVLVFARSGEHSQTHVCLSTDFLSIAFSHPLIADSFTPPESTLFYSKTAPFSLLPVHDTSAFTTSRSSLCPAPSALLTPLSGRSSPRPLFFSYLISTSTLASSFLDIMNSTLVDVLLFLLFLTLTLASPLAFPNPHPDPHPLDPATAPSATIIPARVHPNYHDPALGLSGIQIAGIIICSLVGLFILGFLALVTWDSYQDGKRRRGMDDFDDFGFGFPVSDPSLLSSIVLPSQFFSAPAALCSRAPESLRGIIVATAFWLAPRALLPLLAPLCSAPLAAPTAEQPHPKHAKHLLHPPNPPHDAAQYVPIFFPADACPHRITLPTHVSPPTPSRPVRPRATSLTGLSTTSPLGSLRCHRA